MKCSNTWEKTSENTHTQVGAAFLQTTCHVSRVPHTVVMSTLHHQQSEKDKIEATFYRYPPTLRKIHLPVYFCFLPRCQEESNQVDSRAVVSAKRETSTGESSSSPVPWLWQKVCMHTSIADTQGVLNKVMCVCYSQFVYVCLQRREESISLLEISPWVTQSGSPPYAYNIIWQRQTIAVIH